MTLMNISAAQFITGKLRQNLTDYNLTNRSATFGQYIYADAPMISKLLKNKNNFPRISVQNISQSTSEDMSFSCSDTEDSVNIKINVWSVRDLICEIQRTTDETHTYTSTTSTYPLTNIPTSNIISIFPFIKNTDFILADSTGDGLYDSVEWIGNHPVNGENFNITYTRMASAAELCRIISMDIHKYIRENWRLWDGLPLYNYVLTANNPISFDENIGIFRQELQMSFRGINIGESV